MSTIATLAIKIIGDVAGLEQALNKAQQSLKAAGDNLTNLGGKLTAGVSLPLLGVGGAALKAAADNEQLQVAFTTMLGSADKAKTLMSDLARFAAATPFESDEIQGAAKMLLAYGSSAGSVTEEMRQLGDIAAGVGVPLKDLAYLYGTSRVQGRLFTADINQFTSRGVPIIEALAKTMGVAQTEIRGMVEAGKVGFPELQAALGYLTGEGGKFNGLMQAQSQTLTGLLSTLRDNVSLAAIDIGNAISQAFNLKDAATGAIAFVESIRNAISDLSKNNPQLLRLGVIIAAVAASLGPLLVGLGMALKVAAALTPVVGVLGAALGALLSPLGLVTAGIAALVAFDVGGIRTGLGTLAQYLQLAATDGDYLNDFLASLPGWAQPAAETLGRLVAAVGELVRTRDAAQFVADLRATFPALTGVLDGVTSAFGAVQARWAALAGAFAAGRTSLGGIAGELGAILLGIGANSYATAGSIRAFVLALTGSAGAANAVESALRGVGAVTTAIATALAQAGGVLHAFAAYLFEAGVSGRSVNQWLGRLPEVVRPAVATLGQVAAALRGLVTTGDLGGFVVRLGQINWGNALASVQRSLDALRSRIATALQSVDWGGLAGSLAGGLRALAGSVLAAIQSIDWGAALSAASGALAALRDGLAGALASIDWGGALAAAGGWASALAAGVAGAIASVDWGGALPAVSGALSALAGGITAAFRQVDLSAAVVTAGGWLRGLAESLAGGLRGALAGIDLAGAGEQLLAALGLDGLPEAVGAALAPLRTLGGMLASFFAPALGRLQQAFARLPAAIAPLAPKLQALGEALRPFAALLGAGLAAAADLGVNTLAAALDVLPGIAGAAIDQMAAALRLFASAFGSVVQAVSAALRGDWATAWAGARGIVTGFVAFLGGTLERQATVVGGLIQAIARPILDTLSDLGMDVEGLLGGIRDAFASAWGGVAGAIEPALGAIGDLGAALSGLMQGGDLGAFVQSIGAIDWGAALGALDGAMGQLASGLAAALQSIDWGGALTTAGNWLSGLTAGVLAAVQSIDWAGALGTAVGWLDGLKNGMIAAITSIAWGDALAAAGSFLDALKNSVIAAVQGIDWAGALSTAGDWLAGLWGSVTSSLQSIDWAGALSTAGDWLASLQDGVVGAVTSVPWADALTAAGDFVAELKNGVIAAIQSIDWGGLLTAAGDWLAELWGGVAAGLSAIPWADALATATGWLDGLTAGVVGAIKGFDWAGALSAAGDAFAGLETAVSDGLRGLGFEGAASALDGLAAALSSALPSAATAAQAAMGTINAALYSAKSALDSASGAVGAFLATDAWTTAQTDITAALGAIGTAVTGLFTGDVSLAELKDSILTQFGEIQTSLAELFASEEWAALGTSLLAAFGLEGLAADIGTKIEGVKTAFQPLLDFLEPAFTRLSATVGGLPAQFDDLSAKFEPLKAAAGELAAALGGLFGGGEGGGSGAGNTVLGVALAGTLSLLTNAVNGLLGALAPLAGTFVDELTTLLSGLAEVVTGLGTAFGGIVANDPTLVLQGLGTAFQGVKDIITGTFENSLNAVQTALASIGTIVTTTLGDWGFGAAATAVDTMVGSINTLLEKIKAIASGDVSINFAAPDWIVKLLDWVWPSLNLPDLLSTLLAWVWPTMTLPDLLASLLAWVWPGFPSLPDWVSNLMNWQWPSLDMPDWISSLFKFQWPSLPELPWWLGGPAQQTENKAVGTSYFGGGYVNASEVGTEVALLPRGVSWLPRGTQILTARESEGFMAGAAGGGGVTIIIQEATFRNERDMQRFAYEVDDLMQRRRR